MFREVGLFLVFSEPEITVGTAGGKGALKVRSLSTPEVSLSYLSYLFIFYSSHVYKIYRFTELKYVLMYLAILWLNNENEVYIFLSYCVLNFIIDITVLNIYLG